MHVLYVCLYFQIIWHPDMKDFGMVSICVFVLLLSVQVRLSYSTLFHKCICMFACQCMMKRFSLNPLSNRSNS